MIQDLDALGRTFNYFLIGFLVLFVMWALVVIPLWRCSFYLKEADKRAMRDSGTD